VTLVFRRRTPSLEGAHLHPSRFDGPDRAFAFSESPEVAVTLSRHAPLACALSVAVLAVAGCGGPGEDVRVSLCKDMAAVELGTTPAWQGSEVATHGYEGASVTLRFSAAGGDGRAVCHYAYDAVEDTALILANPIEAYATSPSKMVLNGRTLTGPALAETVKRAMQKQGRELVDRAREALRPE
jgi:hypothetical protein